MSSNIIETDVLVVGGGSAGIAAAVGASRHGARVSLIERNSYLGGRATASMVGTVCGLYLRENSADFSFAMKGFPMEFCERLQLASKTKPISDLKGLKCLPYGPSAFQKVAKEVLEEAGIQLYFGCSVLNIIGVSQSGINGISAKVSDAEIEFRTAAVIDTSGNAIVSSLGDLPLLVSDEYQAPGQVFSLKNVEEEELFRLNMIVKRAIRKGIDSQELSVDLFQTAIVPGTLNAGAVLIKINFPERFTARDGEKLVLQKRGLKLVYELFGFLREKCAAFKHAEIDEIAPEIGIRSEPRSVGNFMLTGEHVKGCEKFDDGIANGAWPIEFWGNEDEVQMTYFPEKEYYQIPARCLQSAVTRNLFFAGKNMFADEEAIASARVMGTCLGTGFAAGVLAAHFTQQKLLSHAIEKIREAQVYI